MTTKCSWARILFLFVIVPAAHAGSEAITHHFTALPKGASSEGVRGELGAAPLAGDSLMRIHFIDVGQGDCILAEAPNGKALLVDCGSNTFYLNNALPELQHAADSAKAYVDTALKGKPSRIDTIVLTHPHTDHYDLLPYVFRGYDVARLVASGRKEEHGEKTLSSGGELERDSLIPWLDASGSHWTTLPNASAGAEAFGGFGAMRVTVLAANAEDKCGSVNARSIVLLLSLGDFDCILEGDGEGATERAALENAPTPASLDCEVLKVAHHGSQSNGSSGARWCQAIAPETAIVSAGYDPLYGHPSARTMERLEAYTVPAPPHALRVWSGKNIPGDLPDCTEAVYSTAVNGTICISTDGHAYNVQFDTDPPHPWRH